MWECSCTNVDASSGWFRHPSVVPFLGFFQGESNGSRGRIIGAVSRTTNLERLYPMKIAHVTRALGIALLISTSAFADEFTEAVNKAKNVYSGSLCVVCHGQDGKGEYPAWMKESNFEGRMDKSANCLDSSWLLRAKAFQATCRGESPV